MQKAKDSFFTALRDRLAVVNCDRTTVIDGQSRPGILVCENEVAGLDEKLSEVFCVRWGASTRTGTDGPVAADCTITYKTAGSAEQNGIDRGRMLAEMDDELACILAPRSTPKMDFANSEATPIDGHVFWSDGESNVIEESGRLLGRSVTLKVYSHPEEQS